MLNGSAPANPTYDYTGRGSLRLGGTVVMGSFVYAGTGKVLFGGSAPSGFAPIASETKTKVELFPTYKATATICPRYHATVLLQPAYDAEVVLEDGAIIIDTKPYTPALFETRFPIMFAER